MKFRTGYTSLLILFFTCFSISISTAFQYYEWYLVWDELSTEKVLPKRHTNYTRLQCAELLLDTINKILTGQRQISIRQKEKIDYLIEVFRDELFMLELRSRSQLISEWYKYKDLPSMISIRTHLRTEQFINHPDIDSDVKIYTGTNISFNLSNGINSFIRLRAESAAADFSTDRMSVVVDEAYIEMIKKNFMFQLGKIYFLVDKLGLIADNYFDALEGVRFDIRLLRKLPILTFVYSRLSTMNYPYRRFFTSSDDYYLFAIRDVRISSAELGFTYLASGIATEKAVSVDLHTVFGRRQSITEFAVYWPSETDYTATQEAKFACVSGIDVLDSDSFNIFFQAGYVQKGFTPMASSLMYSAGNRLYFDQNTYGVDITFTWQPGRRYKPDTLTLWDTRYDERYDRFTKTLTYEFETVLLWCQNDNSLHSQRFVLRHIRNVYKSLMVYIENNLWVNYNTLNYPNITYNQLRLVFTLEF